MAKKKKGKPNPSVVLSEVEGESSGGESEAAANPTARGRCGQFVWPCPREYPSELATRQKEKWLKPSDMSKEAFGVKFKEVCAKLGEAPNLKNIHVFDEPHKRYNKKTGTRERHKHLIFRMNDPFAHAKIQKELASHGIRGHFSFNLMGYIAYLKYMMCQSAKKLEADLDKEPFSWPKTTFAALQSLANTPTPQIDARNGQGKGRKRALLTFSEVTDVFAEADVANAKDLSWP